MTPAERMEMEVLSYQDKMVSERHFNFCFHSLSFFLRDLLQCLDPSITN